MVTEPVGTAPGRASPCRYLCWYRTDGL